MGKKQRQFNFSRTNKYDLLEVRAMLCLASDQIYTLKDEHNVCADWQ